MRADLCDELADRVGHLAELVAAANPAAAIAVIVDANGAQCPRCNEEYRQLCAALAAALSQRDIVLWAAHVVDRVAAGGRWHCVDGCGCSGVIDDPSASPLAMAAVLDGRQLYPRRSDLQAVIAVDDPVRSAELAVALGHQAADREIAHRADSVGCSRQDVEMRWPPRPGSQTVSPCPTRSWRGWVAHWATRGSATCCMPLPSARMLVRPSHCGRYWRGCCPNRGGWRPWCCSRSAPMPAVTGRWPVFRCRLRCAVSRAIGWRACWTRHCSLVCDLSTSVTSRSPATNGLNNSEYDCRLDVRSVNAQGRCGLAQTFSTLTAWAISCGRVTFSWPGMTMVTPPPGVVSTVTRALGTTPASFSRVIRSMSP